MKNTALKELISLMENSPSCNNPFEWKRAAKSLLDYEKTIIVESFHQGRLQHAIEVLNDEGVKSWDDLKHINPFEEGNKYFNETFSEL